MPAQAKQAIVMLRQKYKRLHLRFHASFWSMLTTSATYSLSSHLLHLESIILSAWKSRLIGWPRNFGVSIDPSQHPCRRAMIVTISSEIQSNTYLKTPSHIRVWYSRLRYAIQNHQLAPLLLKLFCPHSPAHTLH